MKKLLLSIFFVTCAGAQTVVGPTDVLSLANVVTGSQVLAFSLTASQGDGTACAVAKITGAALTAILRCTPGDGRASMSAEVLKAGTATAVQSFTLAYGDTFCLLVMNPTAAAVTMGSLGSIPAVGLGWSCTTNIRTAGLITGNTAPVTGSIAWP
jgi:hypothetical protein